jgi:hypothetical protein
MFGLSLIQSMLGSAALAALVTIPATAYITAQPYRVTIAQMERDGAKKDKDSAELVLKKVQSTIGGISKAANEFRLENADLHGKLDAIAEDLAHVQAKHPLPVNCRMDAERLRNLANAVAVANSAIGSKPSR